MLPRLSTYRYAEELMSDLLSLLSVTPYKLTFGPCPPDASAPYLVIPNLVIRELQWEYLALALKDQEDIWLNNSDLKRALKAMAVEGDIAPLLAVFQEQVVGRIGNKDLRQFNEKVLKLMLLAQALTQLDRYGSDKKLISLLTLGKELKAGALVFVGAKTVLFRPWPRELMPATKKKSGAKKKAAAKTAKKRSAKPNRSA